MILNIIITIVCSLNSLFFILLYKYYYNNMEKELPLTFNDEVMFGDYLEEVSAEEMKQPQHCNTGALTFRSRKEDNLGNGTGTLISSNIVLTAAHNIYNRNTGEMYFDFKFYPGANGVLDEHYEVEDFYIPGKYVLNPIEVNDYALLKLKKKVERK